jgi:hypothetical protein
VGRYYLSDVSYGRLRLDAKKAGTNVSAYVEEAVKRGNWIHDDVVIRDSGLLELIQARTDELERQRSASALARGDKRRRTVGPEIMYDGVVYNAMFAWGREVRELKLSEEVEAKLCEWLMSQGVVQRRAASVRTRAGCALELIGRGWIDG